MSERIPLQFYAENDCQRVEMTTLPVLCGAIELSINGVDTKSTSAMLAVLFSSQESLRKIDVSLLTASDRDAILAALYRQYWGDSIVSTLTCNHCTEQFDLSFSLAELQDHLKNKVLDWKLERNAEVKIEAQSQNLKIPIFDEESNLSEMNPKAARKHLEGLLNISHAECDALIEKLDEIAPIIDVDITAVCPECDTSHKAGFDIQSFTMQRLINEKKQLLQEIHLMAVQYGWSLNDILKLDRLTRKVMCEMIDSRAMEVGM